MPEPQDTQIAPGAAPPPSGYRERYFWHERAWGAITRDLGKIPHALLLHGSRGLGKREFAWRLAQLLLCTASRSDDAEGCGECQSCRRFVAGMHPDLLRITPSGDSASIVVDQIRELRQFVALKPHTASRKLVLLESAEAMNLNAANALLKVLEEPPPSSLLILIAQSRARLPATIRSRCTPLPFHSPGSRQALEWLRVQGIAESSANQLLALTGGAPLRALALARSTELEDRNSWLKDVEDLRAGRADPLQCAVRWKNYGTDRSLEWFQQYLADSIRAEMVNGTKNKNSIPVGNLFRYSDVLSEAKAVTGGPLDETLLLEDILIGWSRLFRPLV